MLVRSFSIAILLVLSSAVRADWQFTKWGMSLTDLLAVGKGNVARLTAQDAEKQKMGGGLGSPAAMGVYRSKEFKFSTYYYLKNGKLAAVRLLPEPVADGVRVWHQLSAVYGKSIEEDDKTIGGCRIRSARWRDIAGGNVIQYSDVACFGSGGPSDSAAVLYEPLPRKGESGL